MQEVFDKIIEKLEACKDIMLSTKDHDCFGEECKYQDCTACTFAKAIEIVKQAVAEYNNGWIPCSERLPEEMELVLIYAESTARGGSIRVVAQLDNGFWFAQTSSETLGLTGIGQYEVIAWQPLPEPYQTEGE